MEWEVRLIEWMQANIGSSVKLVELLAFIGAEKGLLICVLIVMFCWKKEVGQKLALIVSCVNLWLTLIKSIVLRPVTEELVRIKMETSELGTGSKITELNKYIIEQLELLQEAADRAENRKNDWDLLEGFFRKAVLL